MPRPAPNSDPEDVYRVLMTLRYEYPASPLHELADLIDWAVIRGYDEPFDAYELRVERPGLELL